MLPGDPIESTERIRFQCPGCSRRLKARLSMAGKPLRCPNCGASTTVPPARSAGRGAVPDVEVPTRVDDGTAEEDDGRRIRFPCDNCHRTLKVHPSSHGRRVRCPSCGTSQRVPRNTPKGLSEASKSTAVEATQVDFENQLPPACPRVEVSELDHLAAASGELSSLVRSAPKSGGFSLKRKSGQSLDSKVAALVGTAVGVLIMAVIAVIVSVSIGTGRDAPSSTPAADQEQSRLLADAESSPTVEALPSSPTEPSTQPVERATVVRRRKTAPPVSKRAQESVAASEPSDRDTSDRPRNVASSDPVEVSRPLTLRDVVQRTEAGVVLISLYDGLGTELGLGSGFLIDPSGLVATNYHVIEEGAFAVARFRNGEQFDVVGFRAVHPETDLAIVQLSGIPNDAEIISLDDTVDPHSGDEVIALGHPAGFDFTVTTGIVSAVRTSAQLPEEVREFLSGNDDTVWVQTTADISPGNSGGPLLTRDGRLLGVNSWVVDNSDLHFAVSARHLRELRDSMSDTATPLPVSGDSGQPQFDPTVREMLIDFARKWSRFQQLLTEAETPIDRQRIFERFSPVPEAMTQFVDLADENRRQPIARDALSAACMVARDSNRATERLFKKSTRRLLDDHLDDEQLAGVAFGLVTLTEQDPRLFLRELSRKSPHRSVQGIAHLALAVVFMRHLGVNGKGERQVIEMLEKVTNDYGDIQVGEETLAEIAGPKLFEMKYLAIGKRPPDIVGQDFDGFEFRLSDYRGKVVVLDFWADWCPHCKEMYPTHRKLVEKNRRNPFALLGVNADTRERARQANDLHRFPWRNWWDGPSGPIASEWNITSYPTIFVLDHRGIIRFKDVRGADLDRAVEVLLAEMQ